MKEQKQQEIDCSEKICELTTLIEETINHMELFEEEAGENVKADDADESVMDQLRQIQRLSCKVKDQVLSNWVGKLRSHKPLTEEEFHLMCAHRFDFWSAKRLGISPVDDYELYQNCCCEDERESFYLIPEESADVEGIDKETGHKTVRIRLGKSPEEIRWDDLTVLQKMFFETHLPDVAARFRRD